jgi:hypothetical protein
MLSRVLLDAVQLLALVAIMLGVYAVAPAGWVLIIDGLIALAAALVAQNEV